MNDRLGDNLYSLWNILDPDFIPEFSRLHEDGALGVYGEFLVDEAARGLNLGRLFDRGVRDLASLETRPDLQLAAYFLVLSSFRPLSRNTRGVALDAMVYCETEEGDGFAPPKEELLAMFQTAREEF